MQKTKERESPKENNNKDAFLLQVDFEGAFDSVEHFYMRHVLRYIGVGPVFTRLALSVMSGMKMSVIVNDQQTMFINVKNGLTQGCALSAIFFIIAEEPLLCAAKNCVSSSSYYKLQMIEIFQAIASPGDSVERLRVYVECILLAQ